MSKDTPSKDDSVNTDDLQEKINILMGPEPGSAPAGRKITITQESDSAEAEPSTAPVVSATTSKLTKKEATAIGEAIITQEAETVALPEVDPSDDEVDAVVNEIASNESDALLEAEDEKLAQAFTDHKPGIKEKIGHFFSAWWHSKKARTTTILVLLTIIVAVLAVPNSRYYILNTAGVRSSASIQIIDSSTLQPLKNVNVALSGLNVQTDKDGNAVFTNIKLGRSELVVDKRGFASTRQTLTVGWGSNPLGDRKLQPTGTQFTIMVTDFLSDTPLDGIEATSGQASAVSDEKGKIVITLDKDELANEVTIASDTIRTETIKLPEDPAQAIQVKAVPSRQHAYISKRSGKYDVYKIDLDGKNESLVLAGTGSERDDLSIVAHPTKNVVALVSTRANKRNTDGYLLSDLTVIDLDTDDSSAVTQSERIQLIDWAGDQLVYVQTAAGSSAASAKRNRLSVYDNDSGRGRELASANYFSDVTVVGTNVYYAPALAYGAGDVGLYKIGADGTSKVSILDKEVWSLYRVSYDNLTIAVDGDWYDYEIGKPTATKAAGSPANPISREYKDSPDKKHSLWVDQRDGKGFLLSYDTATQEDTVLQTLGGLKVPTYWINNATLVYRINKTGETADYVLSINGGEPRKLADVTDTGGVQNY